MNKFLVFISVSALFVTSNSFGDYIVCSKKEIKSDTPNTKSNAEEICKELCGKEGWSNFNTTATNDCSGNFCVCYGTAPSYPS